MTVAQLKAALKKAKIDFDPKAKKADLVALMEGGEVRAGGMKWKGGAPRHAMEGRGRVAWGVPPLGGAEARRC